MDRRVGPDGDSVAAEVRELALGCTAVMRAVIKIGTPLVDDPDRVGALSALGVDEHACQHATAHRKTQRATGIVDLSPGRPAR